MSFLCSRSQCTSSSHICVDIICLFCRIHFTVTSVQRRRIKGKNPNAYTTFCQVLIYCYSCNIRGHTERRISFQWDHGCNWKHALSVGHYLKNKHETQMLIFNTQRFLSYSWFSLWEVTVYECVCVIAVPVCLWGCQREYLPLVRAPPCLWISGSGTNSSSFLIGVRSGA